MSRTDFEDNRLSFATGWLGYGSWAAPYWFVGMEPGEDDDEANFAIWSEADRPQLLDITAHLPGQVGDWFSPDSRIQSTWAKLIWALLSYKGLEATAEATRGYQQNHLGRSKGETALLELSPFSARSSTVKAPRTIARENRIITIRQQLAAKKPDFVVFYSVSPEYKLAWEEIAGSELPEGQPVLLESTACVRTYHPNYKWDKAYWVDIGRRLREARESYLGSP